MGNQGNLNEKAIHEYQRMVSENSKLFISDETKCRYYDWHRGFSHVGTKSELIAEGLAKDGWFPGDPGNNKTSLKVIFNDSLLEGVVRNGRARMQSGQRCLEITRTGSRYEKFKILDMFPVSIKAEYDEARSKKWRAEMEQNKAEEEYERAKFWEHYKIERRLNSIDEARIKVSKQYEIIEAVINSTYQELSDSGYVVTDSHIEKLKEVLVDLIDVFKDVTFEYSPDLRVQADLELKHKTAITDLKFNHFLNGITQSNIELGE